ncbi:TetR/AcrR family transcriptional regulator [Mucilaginibacter celer]|uniref:TetR family transcriptional regulator n=1 Tax=Mucilaginibacter celer TaxID=2305508 RepID=A0A494VSB3_9SPHI|nr:TetR/AcrR family transcriptional regulator [Mucilaginibacter celer]AYL97824.1 TetR family transcriptional regulator [Mucilaginibacter celer]
MGVSERKEREKMEMKELIKAAALKLFLEDGVAKTSIRNIADEIEYSPGTIYLYYKDKDELLYEVQSEAFGKLLKVFEENATSEDPVERLLQLSRTYINFGLNNPELYDLMFIIRAPTNVDEEIHKANGGNCLDFLTDCLAACVAGDSLVVTNVQAATLQMWAMVHGLVSLNLRCRLKVMDASEEEIPHILLATMESYIRSVTK